MYRIIRSLPADGIDARHAPGKGREHGIQLQRDVGDTWGGRRSSSPSCCSSWDSSSLTVFIERLLTLRRSRRASRRSSPPRSGGHLRADDARDRDRGGRQVPNGHLPRLVKTALATLRHARETADVSRCRRRSARAGTWSATWRTSAPTCAAAWRCSRRSVRSRRSSDCSAPCSESSPPSRASPRRGSGGLSVGVGRHLGGAHRDGARSRGRHPVGARLQLPVHQDRPRRGCAQQRRRRAARQHRGLGGEGAAGARAARPSAKAGVQRGPVA